MLENDSIARFKNACINFDVNSTAKVSVLATNLDDIAMNLAEHPDLRQNLGGDRSLWTDLRKLWRDLARAQLTFWDSDDSEADEGTGERNKQAGLRTLCGSLGRFTRNLVASIAENQNRAFENEPDIRRLLHYYTSWSAMEDNDSILVARILAQTLSNLVTNNESLMNKLWDAYMNLPEDQVVVIRLLSSPDPRTLLAALILILNCVRGSKTRIKMLTKSKIGIRVCVCMLDGMVSLYDAEDGSDGAKAFDVGYEVFTRVIEGGLIPDLYTRLAIQDEIITPHQTTLLKLVDSYLQSSKLASNPPVTQTVQTYGNLSPMLSDTFFTLSVYALQAIRRSLGPSANEVQSNNTFTTSSDPLQPNHVHEPPAELDVMLPKVCEALVLITQCIVTITLQAEGRNSDSGFTGSVQNWKDFFAESGRATQGFIETLIDLLRLLDLFLPRINFGRPVTSSPPGSAQAAPTPAQPSSAGFSYLKRDLVRLLGILCHGAKAVQDRARQCGGIQVIMNLCVVDERNPYLREHAIFTLHNLLENNRENQAVVESIKPDGVWDESGTLRTTPAAVRK